MHHHVHVPYASAAFYLHPVELLILDNGAAFVASRLFPSMRFWTALALQLLLPIRAAHEHLGYSFPWDADEKFGTAKATHHAIHHMPKGHKWNYATPFFTITGADAHKHASDRASPHPLSVQMTCLARATPGTRSCGSCELRARQRRSD